MDQPLRNEPELAKTEQYIESLRETAHENSNAFKYDAYLWDNRHIRLGLPTVIAGIIASSSAFINLGKSSLIAGIVVALFTVVSSVFAGITTWLNPRERAEKYDAFAKRYAAFEDEIIALRFDLDRLSRAQIDARIKQLRQKNETLRHERPLPGHRVFYRLRHE